MLRRVFGERKTGFYIDVGAMDPVIESVTKFFYDQGWCGINIEPNESFFLKLNSQRERDINLNVAIGDREEARTLYASNETGLSTLDERNRDLFVERGFQSEEKTIRVTTLAAVCQEYVDRPIDFLKIDCEGWEKRALAGADWSRFRPTVVVVEATLPNNRVPAWSEWEPILVEEGEYDMVYFDGLNRFYLRRDSPGLRTHFATPPNVFDKFKVYATELAEQAAQAIKQELDNFAERVVELEQTIGKAKSDQEKLIELLRAAEAEMSRVSADAKNAALLSEKELAARAARIRELENERCELSQALLKARLWVGQLSQDRAVGKRSRAV